MGTDIYFMFQSREANGWEDIPCELNGYNSARDRVLFAWLALGGGNKIGSYSIAPLAAPRGFPPDFAIVDKVWHPIKDIHVLPERNRGFFQKRDMRTLMGDVDFSYHLAFEVLKAAPPKARCVMSLPIDAYRRWGGRGVPEGASMERGDWGEHTAYAGQHYASPGEIDEATRVVVFEVEYDFAGEIAWFRELLEQLSEAHGEVRFVFGFA